MRPCWAELEGKEVKRTVAVPGLVGKLWQKHELPSSWLLQRLGLLPRIQAQEPCGSA